MRKLKLDLTGLEVTSFEIPADGAGRGTIAGHKTAPETLASGCPTCVASCGGACGSDPAGYTCWESCAGTCDSCAPSCNLATCDNMATCLQYYTCYYNSCTPEVCA